MTRKTKTVDRRASSHGSLDEPDRCHAFRRDVHEPTKTRLLALVHEAQTVIREAR